MLNYDFKLQESSIETNEDFDLSSINLGICKPIGTIFKNCEFQLQLTNENFNKFIDSDNVMLDRNKVFNFYIGTTKFLARGFIIESYTVVNNSINLLILWFMVA